MSTSNNQQQITEHSGRAGAIHVWVPDFAGATGGIQTFSRFLVHGLKRCFPQANLTVFAKNDTSVPSPEESEMARFHSVGTWPGWQRTVAFTSMLITNAIRHKPDLIVIAHINFAPAAHLVHRLMGIPYVVVGHGVEIWKKPNQQLRTALRNAAKLLAVSGYTRDRMSEVLNLPCESIDLLPNTFDPGAFVPALKPRFLLKRYGLRNDQPVVLTIARLASAERYKGYDQVLQALVKVREDFPDVCYLLGGRGPDRSRVQYLVTDLDLQENVILAGYISDQELLAHYNLCDVFAMPSKGEGFGIVFLEAAACGKPVIAGNKDGSVDALLNGRLGSLVDPDDVSQIAEAICAALARRSGDRSQESAELRSQVIDAYGYDRFRERLATIVVPLLEQRNAPPSG